MARDKVFGLGRPRKLDREGKVRLAMLARFLKRKTEAGRHYGELTAKMVDVLEALLFQFHNARSGLCFPSIKAIAEAALCSRDTVQRALKALERLGFLTWVHRLKRVREHGPAGWRWRVLRTSNGYQFNDPRSDTDQRPRTRNQDHHSVEERPRIEKRRHPGDWMPPQTEVLGAP